MSELFGVPMTTLAGQLMLGIINGAFYAILSLGLAVVFGLLNVINFAHGAQYMLGALVAWVLLNSWGISYWWSLLLAPMAVGAIGLVLEKFLIARVAYDHRYGMLVTYGLALIAQGLVRDHFGAAGLPYSVPEALRGGVDLGFVFAPYYRVWVVAASLTLCVLTYLCIEKTPLGANLRAATENGALAECFGINVKLLSTLTYGAAVALAAFAGVLAAPMYSVNPVMGADLIIVVFAVVVIGGMGSLSGAVVAGLGLGIAEGLTKTFYPPASNIVIFIIMAVVLTLRPAGLFGRDKG